MKEGAEMGVTSQKSRWQGFRTRGSRETPLLPGSGPWKLQASPQECACSRSHGNGQAAPALR